MIISTIQIYKKGIFSANKSKYLHMWIFLFIFALQK
nr:MAG TPA: hypothetical protein [Bacteriophage sp.]